MAAIPDNIGLQFMVNSEFENRLEQYVTPTTEFQQIYTGNWDTGTTASNWANTTVRGSDMIDAMRFTYGGNQPKTFKTKHPIHIPTSKIPISFKNINFWTDTDDGTIVIECMQGWEISIGGVDIQTQEGLDEALALVRKEGSKVEIPQEMFEL